MAAAADGIAAPVTEIATVEETIVARIVAQVVDMGVENAGFAGPGSVRPGSEAQGYAA